MIPWAITCFYQLIEGEYIVKADLHPSSELFDLFMTTYYSDKLHWDEADTIYHHQTSFEYDINLAPNTQSSAAGPGCIQGGIAYDPSYYGGGKSAPAENITILLYDEFNQPATICHSDENGQFSLDDLNLQKYFVYAEVTGKYTIPVEVELGTVQYRNNKRHHPNQPGLRQWRRQPQCGRKLAGAGVE